MLSESSALRKQEGTEATLHPVFSTSTCHSWCRMRRVAVWRQRICKRAGTRKHSWVCGLASTLNRQSRSLVGSSGGSVCVTVACTSKRPREEHGVYLLYIHTCLPLKTDWLHSTARQASWKSLVGENRTGDETPSPVSRRLDGTARRTRHTSRVVSRPPRASAWSNLSV
jgi:hypothetical protein